MNLFFASPFFLLVAVLFICSSVVTFLSKVTIRTPLSRQTRRPHRKIAGASGKEVCERLTFTTKAKTNDEGLANTRDGNEEVAAHCSKQIRRRGSEAAHNEDLEEYMRTTVGPDTVSATLNLASSTF